MKILIVLLLIPLTVFTQPYSCKIGLLKYRGGGDWYANLETSLKNLILYSNQHNGTNIDPEQSIVEAESRDIFNYPLVHVTGHGNITFNESERSNIRSYLLAGGFLHIDDNYGMDVFIRNEMKSVFPELEFVELPSDHEIYRTPYHFPQGLPKIHEHDGKEAKGYGLIWNGRLICFYTLESDLGDGWESPEVHNDSPEKRSKALQMGTNILHYAFMGDEMLE